MDKTNEYVAGQQTKVPETITTLKIGIGTGIKLGVGFAIGVTLVSIAITLVFGAFAVSLLQAIF